MMALNRSGPPGGQPTRVLLVDDHPIVRQGLAQLLEQEEDLRVCGEAQDAQGALDAIKRLEPDIAIVDIMLKDVNGIELIKKIKSQFGEIPVLVMSMHDESLYAERALRAGARGYIMKEEAADKILTAVRKVMRGEIYLSDGMVSRILHRLADGRSSADSPLDRLSDREDYRDLDRGCPGPAREFFAQRSRFPYSKQRK